MAPKNFPSAQEINDVGKIFACRRMDNGIVDQHLDPLDSQLNEIPIEEQALQLIQCMLKVSSAFFREVEVGDWMVHAVECHHDALPFVARMPGRAAAPEVETGSLATAFDRQKACLTAVYLPMFSKEHNIIYSLFTNIVKYTEVISRPMGFPRRSPHSVQ